MCCFALINSTALITKTAQPHESQDHYGALLTVHGETLAMISAILAMQEWILHVVKASRKKRNSTREALGPSNADSDCDNDL